MSLNMYIAVYNIHLVYTNFLLKQVLTVTELFLFLQHDVGWPHEGVSGNDKWKVVESKARTRKWLDTLRFGLFGSRK